MSFWNEKKEKKKYINMKVEEPKKNAEQMVTEVFFISFYMRSFRYFTML